MKRLVGIAVAVCLMCGGSAQGWERDTQLVIVTTSMHMLAKGGLVQLPKLQNEIQEGAGAGTQMQAQLYPALSSGAERAVEAEMYLLEAMRGSSLDPYFAYRLGALGSMVASLTAPLNASKSAYKEQYFSDAAANVRRVVFKPSARKLVDPVPYLERVKNLANQRNDMLIKDYQEGLGFNGVAKSALVEDFSRSVDAVADVWNTILTANVAHAGISTAQKTEYVVSAMQFYLARGNANEIDNNYVRLTQVVPKSPQLAKRIGDMFYDAKLFERAIKEYAIVLAAEPRRRDVVEKIGAYYVSVGDDHLDDNHLELALDAYTKAAEQDPLNTVAEARRIETEALIGERDARLAASRRYIEEAAQFQRQAEELQQQSRFADAFGRLKDAEARYSMVSGEFVTESQAANAGLANITTQLKELKTLLIENSQSLSGSGFSYTFQQQAVKNGQEISKQALMKLNAHQLDQEIARIKEECRPWAKID